MAFLAAAAPSLISAAATGAGGAAASFGLSKLFGGGKGSRRVGQEPRGLSAGGLTSDRFGNTSASAQRQAFVDDAARGFGLEAEEFGRLRERVAPGIEGITNFALQDIDDTFQQDSQRLQTALQRRNLAGSSFGRAERQRLANSHANQRQRAIVEAEIQKIVAERELIPKQLEAFRNQFERQVSELNLQADFGNKVRTAGLQASASMANAKAKIFELEQTEAARSGDFFGKIAGHLGQGLIDTLAQRQARSNIGAFTTSVRGPDGGLLDL